MIDRLLLSLAVATANVDRLSRSVQPRVRIDVTVFSPDGYRAVRLLPPLKFAPANPLIAIQAETKL